MTHSSFKPDNLSTRFLRALFPALLLLLPVLQPCALAQAPSVRIYFPLPEPLYYPVDTVTFTFVGDVMMHSGQIQNASRENGRSYDFSGCLDNLAPIFEAADVSVANMEFTLGGRPYTGYPCFSAPEGWPRHAADCGIDIFLTANNHILDKGEAGLERTLELYDGMNREEGIRHTGCSSGPEDDEARYPLMVRCRCFRIALLNFTYGTNVGDTSPGSPLKINMMDKEDISLAIGRAREKGADFIVALPHWGIEYDLHHCAEQERFALWLASQGVDAIIGAHPHVVQDWDVISVETPQGTKDVPVIYSMGNCISNMSATNTQTGLCVSLKFVRDKFGKKTMLPPECTLTWCSRPGGLTGGYTTIPVRDYTGKRDEWLQAADYDKMTSTCTRVSRETGITDGPIQYSK